MKKCLTNKLKRVYNAIAIGEVYIKKIINYPDHILQQEIYYLGGVSNSSVKDYWQKNGEELNKEEQKPVHNGW